MVDLCIFTGFENILTIELDLRSLACTDTKLQTRHSKRSHSTNTSDIANRHRYIVGVNVRGV